MKISKEAKVGILAISAIVILYIGFNFLKGINFFDPSVTYYAVYSNVDGLSVSNPVKINGYRIGRVSSIELLQAGEEPRMLVGMDVTDDLKVFRGSKAVLVDDDLLGSKAIVMQIEAGGPLLDEGDTLISVIDQPLTAMIQERADPIIADIDTTLTRVNNILGELSGSGGKVESAVGELDQTAQLLKQMVLENRRDINVIINNMRQLTEALTDPESGIKPFVAKLNQVADTLNDLQLKQTVASANQAIASLEKITKGLENGDGSLGKLLQDDSLYTNLNKSSADLDRLLIDIRENPGRYIDLDFSLIGGGKK
ncbi:MlaD family protein [Nafulsella turpanensis]|uniref:MlaD family protein n=1 Tax=Nafulsella turpanensis TaxID=1265690 RepID=UPI000344F496|nr:MlaD family protein [Nafulsella turpanensis]